MTTTPTLTARLSALVDALDAHVQGDPNARTLGSIAADLDDLQDDLECLERGIPAVTGDAWQLTVTVAALPEVQGRTARQQLRDAFDREAGAVPQLRSGERDFEVLAVAAGSADLYRIDA